jgi:hypothetical protein
MAKRYEIKYQVVRIGFGDTKEEAIEDARYYEEDFNDNPLKNAEVIAIEEEE